MGVLVENCMQLVHSGSRYLKFYLIKKFIWGKSKKKMAKENGKVYSTTIFVQRLINYRRNDIFTEH